MKQNYKKMVCTQCGGNEMLKEHKQLRCAYCHTVYKAVENKAHTPNNKVNFSKKQKKVIIIVCSIFVMFYIFIFVLSLISNKSTNRLNSLTSIIGNKSSNYESPDVKGLQNIESINGWSEKIYNNIEIAKPTYNEDGKAYSKGTKYSKLIAKVGAPKTIRIWKNSNDNQREATFNTNRISKYNVSISISYDKDSDYITSKSIIGYNSYDTIYSNKKKETVFSSLGWSEELYNSIDTATKIIDRSDNITTYEHGELISSLLKKVPEPNQINHEKDDNNKITTYKWREDYSFSITITVDDATGRIIDKSTF